MQYLNSKIPPLTPPSTNDNDRWYHLKEWKKARRTQLQEFPLCAHCLLLNRTKIAKHVDHIIPRSMGGAEYDPENMQSLCHSCHSKKTRKEQGRRH